MTHTHAETAVCFIGLPGAGKTTAAGMATEAVDGGMHISTGDIVRELAAEHFDLDVEDLDGEQVGEFSTMKRESDSPMYVAREVCDRLGESGELINTITTVPVMIEGVRDSESVSYYQERIDEFHIVYITAPFGARLKRLDARGRGRRSDGDGDAPSADDLIHRESRELGWGMDELPDHSDHVIMNAGDSLDLQRKVLTTLADIGVLG